MLSEKSARLILLLAAIGAFAVSSTGCQDIREAVGATKQPPDEFAVTTKAPLIIPPDYELRPPKPGAPPVNQVPPSAAAQAALYSDDPATVAGAIPGNYSQAEKLLLAQAGAATADDSVRQQIAADNRRMQTADESFTDRLLFGGPDAASPDSPIDPDAEKARIDASKNAPASVTNPQQAPQQQKKDSGGWLDGIF
ncbi:MAG TPA: DUF3035 domain-containing protein [Rhizomicrobium sp.]|jgi:hypothetical protein|nr:DUF3035 domain-containing protein [Rhizomicrobium sp.]